MTPITPGNDAVLREWLLEIRDAYNQDGIKPRPSEVLLAFAEAVAVAERERAAGQLRLRADCGCGVCELARKQYTDRIRSLRGLPEIGRPGK